MHVAVGILGPGFQNCEASPVELPQAVQTGMHARRHPSRVSVSESDRGVIISDKFIRKTHRVALDVIKDRSADIHFFSVRVPASQSKWIGYWLLRIIKV